MIIRSADELKQHEFEDSCFLCHGKLTYPAVHWMGSTGDIVLHPACVLDLFVRMARDLHQIKVDGVGYPF